MANGVAQAFDIFSFSEKFEKVGFPKDQIRVIIEAISASRSNPEAVSHAELREHKTEVKADNEKQKSEVLRAIEGLRHEMLDLRKDIEISRKHAESLVDKAKFHLLSWMVALTLGPTVFRNLWQFLSISGVSH